MGIVTIQIAVILIFANLAGYGLSKLKQPFVIGEIVAGILLGPSFLGRISPSVSRALFPENSLNTLTILSQIGLILFMFAIGAELELKAVRKRIGSLVFISQFSMIIPFALGLGAAYFLYDQFAPHNVAFLGFALFIGISMSITAFPVLARMVKERGLSHTDIGITALTCAAINDIVAWCLLAAVVAVVRKGSVVSSFHTILLCLCYVLVMILVVRPFLRRVLINSTKANVVGRGSMAIILVLLLISSWVTENIGIHSLFGAFFAGLVLPGGADFRKTIIKNIGHLGMVLLLPLFFVISGLRTRVELMNDTHTLIVGSLVILTAIAGKLGGTALAARLARYSLKDSLSIGALMNTRGLMELIVLNIGYDLGVFSSSMFTIMVLMALISTIVTFPILDLIERLMPGPITTLHNNDQQRDKSDVQLLREPGPS
jgi:Kef-type K+ transport system membrane component KefB